MNENNEFVERLNHLSGALRDMLEIGAIARTDALDEDERERESGRMAELFESVESVLTDERDVVGSRQPDYYTLMTRGYYWPWDRRNLSAYHYYYLLTYRIWKFFKGNACMEFTRRRASEKFADVLHSAAERILALCYDILNSYTVGMQSEAMIASEEERQAYLGLISADLSFVFFGTKEGKEGLV